MDKYVYYELEKILKNKNFDISQRQLIFVGSVTKSIYSKELFNKNQDLKDYIGIFEKNSFSKIIFKDYLYSSRTNLAARIARLLLNDAELPNLNNLIILHLEFIKKKIEIENNKGSDTKNRKETTLLNDMITNTKKRNEN